MYNRIRPYDQVCVCVCVVEKRTLMACARELCPTTAARTKGEFHLVWHHLSAVNNVFKQTKKKKKTVTMVLFFWLLLLFCGAIIVGIYLCIYLWTASAHYHIISMSFVWGRFFYSTHVVVVRVFVVVAVVASKTHAGGTLSFFYPSCFGEQIKRFYIYIYYII